MLVKMLTSLCGPEYTLAPGDRHDFPAEEAESLINAGFAEKAGDDKPAAKKPAAKKAAADEVED